MSRGHLNSIFLVACFVAACGGSAETTGPNSSAWRCADVTQIPEAQCHALVTLYDDTDGEDWANNSGWLEAESPCDWHGVECDGAQVRSISLVANGLSGELPEELGGLGPILSIDLWNNELTGEVPDEIGGLIFLTSLVLSDNQLTGSIPPGIAALPHLNVLRLRNNDLTGSIPDSFVSGGFLALLSLSGNRLSGGIPQVLGELPQLQWLLLHDNMLTGTVPLPVAERGGLIQDAYGVTQCRLSGNPGLTIPDEEEYRLADRDEDGLICTVTLEGD